MIELCPLKVTIETLQDDALLGLFNFHTYPPAVLLVFSLLTFNGVSEYEIGAHSLIDRPMPDRVAN